MSLTIVVIWIKFVSVYFIILYHSHNLVSRVREICCSLLKMKEHRVEVEGDRCKNLLCEASNINLFPVNHNESLIIRRVLCDTGVNGSSLTHSFTLTCLRFLLSDSEVSHASKLRWNQLDEFFCLPIEVICFNSLGSLWKLVGIWYTILRFIISENRDNAVYSSKVVFSEEFYINRDCK